MFKFSFKKRCKRDRLLKQIYLLDSELKVYDYKNASLSEYNLKTNKGRNIKA
jgi:hypothetical protein